MSALIKRTLMKRDGISADEAQSIIDEAYETAQQIISEGGSLDELEEVCYDYFGLEPGYLEGWIF